jgi:dienelactone hydrolase
VLQLVETYARHHGFAVAAIDGPVHGARRADWDAPTTPAGSTVISDFRALWRSDPQIEEMIEDWRAALATIERTLGRPATSIGWHGLSMGTAYGLALCSAEPRIRAAVLGKWGTTHPHGDRLVEAARRTDAAVLFQIMLQDELFSRDGQLALFDAIRSRRKRLAAYPGRHGDPDEDQFNDAARFLVQRLAAP